MDYWWSLEVILFLLALIDTVCVQWMLLEDVWITDISKSWIIPVVPIIWYFIHSDIPILNQIENKRWVLYGIYAFAFSIYSAIVADILPRLLITFFTILTYFNIRQMRKRAILASNTMQQRMQRRDQKLFSISIRQVIIYIFSTWLYPSMTVYLAFIKQSGSETVVEEFLNYLGSPFLIYINNSATFYIYLCTSSSFCAEFKWIILLYCFRHRTVNINFDARRNYNEIQE